VICFRKEKKNSGSKVTGNGNRQYVTRCNRFCFVANVVLVVVFVSLFFMARDS
jgi:hypothetical protein